MIRAPTLVHLLARLRLRRAKRLADLVRNHVDFEFAIQPSTDHLNVGRFDDVSEVGMSLIADLVQIFENYAFSTQILVASCRNPLHIREAALLGADVATMPFKVLEQLLNHPLTDIGLERFLKDWEKVKALKM